MSEPEGPGPDEADETEETLKAIARKIHAGEDDIVLPEEVVREAATGATPSLDEVERKPLATRIREMKVSERIKVAMRGNKEARMILIRDPIALIKRLVLQNPRITEDEVLIVAKDRQAEKDNLRVISENRDWVGNYSIRLALVENPRTPIPKALVLMSALTEKDIRSLSRSRNVPSVVASQARRILYAREQRRKAH